MHTADIFDIAGKTALVTGGSRGIGEMIAAAYVQAGATVYISSRRRDHCDETAKMLSATGKCISVPADISTEAGCRELAETISAQEPMLHILVNNAGVIWNAPLEQFGDDAWDHVFSVNVKAVFHLTRFLLPSLENAWETDDPAHIINLGSTDGIRIPRYETYAYSASKAAVHQLTRHLANQLAPLIVVNAIAPGPFESAMTAPLRGESRQALSGETLLKRFGGPDDVAGVAIFLASRASRYVTGAIVPVDGGLLCATSPLAR
jgi:NAD(P)-dependent dehydrogenase (short-subunit alcohol dehydrogenase family)